MLRALPKLSLYSLLKKRISNENATARHGMTCLTWYDSFSSHGRDNGTARLTAPTAFFSLPVFPCLPILTYAFLFAINRALILVSQPVFDPRQLETRDFLGACHYGLGSQNYESFPQIGLVSPASFR